MPTNAFAGDFELPGDNMHQVREESETLLRIAQRPGIGIRQRRTVCRHTRVRLHHAPVIGGCELQLYLKDDLADPGNTFLGWSPNTRSIAEANYLYVIPSRCEKSRRESSNHRHDA